MSDRPEWVHCVRRSHVDLLHLTWCGRDLRLSPFEFAFVDASHAAENGDRKQRPVACLACVGAITKALRNGGMSDQTVSAEQWWEAVAEYTKNVAQRGYERGYGDSGVDRLTLDGDEQTLLEGMRSGQAEYAAKGFDVETVKRFFPSLPFTQDDAEHLKLIAGQCDALRLGQNHARALRDLAARIAALLPPPPSTGD